MILSMFKKVSSALLSALGFITSQVVMTVAIPFEWAVALIRKEPRKYEDVLADVIRIGAFALVSVALGSTGLIIIAAVMVASMAVELFLNTTRKAKSIMAFVFFSAAAASPTVHATAESVSGVSAETVTEVTAAMEELRNTRDTLEATGAAVVVDVHEPLVTESGSDSMANMTPVDAPAELPTDVEEALAIMLNPEAYKMVDTIVTLAVMGDIASQEEIISEVLDADASGNLAALAAQHHETSANFWGAVNNMVEGDTETLNAVLEEQAVLTIVPEDRRTLRDVGTKAAEHARDLRERLAPGGKGIVYPEGKV